MEKSIGLYIHIPFCKAKCHYCDFNSYSGMEACIDPYFKALEAEAGYWSERLQDHIIGTVFIGGGTPSLVRHVLITRLLDFCRTQFHIKPDAEISIESNPGTLNPEKLRAYRACGINRLSIGLQAWQDRLLKELGRIHDSRMFLENLQAALDAGFEDINTDLIFGLPSQSFNDWTETVDNAAKLGITHISCYDLKIEEGTVFGDRLEKGQLEPMDDELDRRMYRYTIEKLAASGFKHYEISNFALPGRECKHNLIYWKAGEYLGLGAGAHSYLFGKRFNNVSSIDEYMSRAAGLGRSQPGVRQPVAHQQEIDASMYLPEWMYKDIIPIGRDESMSEFVMLGLRLIDGVSLCEFRSRYGEDLKTIYANQLSLLSGRGLLDCQGDRVKLTALGLDLANQVFMEFI